MTSSARSSNLSNHWIFRFFDSLGLFLSLIILYEPNQLSFLLILLACSFGIWLTYSPTSSSHSNLRIQTFLIPLLSAALALILVNIFRASYSFSSLLIFTTIWSLSMFINRYLHNYYSKPLRILFLGKEVKNIKLPSSSTLHSSNLDNLPQTLDWDTIIYESGTLHPPLINWLNTASCSGITVMNTHEAVEVFNGQVSTHQPQWLLNAVKGSNYIPFKRFFDLIAILLCSPLLILVSLGVALVVWFDGGGPILFYQQRMGKNEKPFTLIKFRSMRTDSEKQGHKFASQQDARVTRVGHFLRKYRLDELPQFWNVLKGEMSIIGPRPEQVTFAQDFAQTIPCYSWRHNVNPGITGWAQVRHGYAAGEEETTTKLAYDLFYVKHVSFFLDIKIVLLTIRTILTGFGSR